VNEAMADAGALRLLVEAPPRVPAGDPLVLVVRLENVGTSPVATSSRLNLFEGDLSLLVGPLGGPTTRVTWPQPVDSGLRRATLAPGQRIENGVLVPPPALAGPGVVEIVAEFTPHPAAVVASAPVTVLVEAPSGDEAVARRRLLDDPDLARSLMAATPFAGTAAVDRLAASGPPATRLLAALATESVETVAAVATELVAEAGAVAVARWTAAVLPGGLRAGDERLATVERILAQHAADADDGDGQALSILHETPWPPAASP
jgi:hypothetical protein